VVEGPVGIMIELAQYSNSILAGLGALVLLSLASGGWGTNDEAGRITAISIAFSVAYLPYLFGMWVAQQAQGRQGMREVVWGVAILLRLLGFVYPAILSDDLLRYEWEAGVLERGMNPYRVSPAELGEGNRMIPGYDVAALYGPVLEGVHWLVYTLGLPMKFSAALGEGLFLWVAGRQGWPLWRLVMVAWCPLSIVEYWMNGHADAWLMLFLLLALTGEGAGAWVWLGMATLTKWWPVLLVPVWLRTGYSGAGVGIYAAMLGSCYWLMPLGEWVSKVRFGTGFLGGWQNNAYLYRLLSDKMQAVVLFGVTSLGLGWRGGDRAKLSLAMVSVLLAFSANIHPWYLGWLLPVLGVSGVNPLAWLLPMALLPLAYDPMVGWRLNGSWIEDEMLRIYIWGAVSGFAIYAIARGRSR